ncbi:MAG: hypothetical protein CMJ78_26885 [Planctomycetaceae bacterium]|nr:hypothetical protein [Planctomycetaceae bacterium]
MENAIHQFLALFAKFIVHDVDCNLAKLDQNNGRSNLFACSEVVNRAHCSPNSQVNMKREDILMLAGAAFLVGFSYIDDQWSMFWLCSGLGLGIWTMVAMLNDSKEN